MKIRSATKDDVPQVMAIHRQAIQRTGAGFYSPDVIAAWSAGTDPENLPGTIKRRQENYLSGDTIGFIAEIHQGIVGFGEMIPSRNQLGTVYVHPDHGRKGIGGALMKALEAEAKALGLPELQMDSSLNAEAFYKAHGFEVLEYGEHELRSGAENGVREDAEDS